VPDMRRIVTEHLARGGSFLLVGGMGFIVDAGVYNALVFWGGRGPLFDEPLTAKVLAILVASTVTYFGSHFVTFRDRARNHSLTKFAAFVAINVVAIGLQLACLGFSRYVLGLSGPVADNVSGTLVGQALSTVFRYVAYGRWVFPTRVSARGDGERQSGSTS
jgi:putative flippase GtrA